MKFIAENEEETLKIAAALAEELKPGDVILLHGKLGSGKTVFARGLIRALAGGADLEIPSPTFTLLQTYDSPMGPVSHYDLYRLKDPSEVYELGWEEALNDGITIVEWPERLGTYVPVRRMDIHLANVQHAENKREIEIARAG